MDKFPESGLDVIGVAEQLTPRLRRGSDKSENDIYVGSVLLPRIGIRLRAYVKIFPPKFRGLLAYNEVVTHHLALQCSLPSPFTFLCACRPSQLRAGTRALMRPDPTSDFVLGVASLDGSLKETKQVLTTSGFVIAEVMTWTDVARVAVFDELVGNDDRHLDNLVRLGPADYMVIDNERVLFGENWFSLDLSTLQGRQCDANILAATIAEGSNQVVRQRMMRIAQQYMMTTLLTEPPGADALERRCAAPEGVTGRLITMLNGRRTKLPALMQRHLYKGELFQQSSKR